MKLIDELFIIFAFLAFSVASYDYAVGSKFMLAWLCLGILSCTIHIIVKLKA